MKKQAWERIRNKQYPYDQFHDDCEDNVYVTTFLTEAAVLTVTLGEQKHSYDLAEGVQTVAVPLSGGTPHFDLKRKGTSLAKVVSGKQIIFEETKENSETDGGKHKIFRNFTYGTVIGPVAKSMPASGAKLLGNAEYVNLKTGWFGSKIAGVQTKPEEGSGLEWPVSGLETATYNLRITYSNPGVNDARLTMTINGGRGEAANQTRILPVGFPPTGKGKLTSTSFMWSLFDNTSSIKIDYQLGEKNKKADPAGNDKGSVFIEKIELIKVEPTKKPALRDFSVPEMVKIPGGSFTMGTGNGEPDEAPARKVTLSPFAIGKHEITNEQFETFMAKHRQFRDEYSWRDRDPVIYVKWTEAAGYCNWLSKEQGLDPVYDEKSWEADLSKNGYRLPSEAQWEYVAAGRNENRPYVWGKTEPAKDSAHAARARGEKPNQIPAAIPSAGFLPGVVPVGSIANDRSRDGVMDLAGNVSEWCGDWFDEYDPKASKDPLQTTKSKTGYRAIRGGSWGYYNYSLRVQDREYNTQVYPGYIYIGFRVVLPAKK
jgi:formylglycine-generating enzyme required for sulfatase activity